MTVDQAITAIAANGLAGSSTSLPVRPVSGHEWSLLLPEVIRHRLQGHLASAVRTGAFPVTRSQQRAVEQEHLRALVQVLHLERELLATTSMLDAAGIDYRVLKGPALARIIYAEPGVRIFGDVDLLVAAEHFDGAIERLHAVGHRTRDPVLRSDFARRFGKGLTLVSEAGVECDVHRTLVLGPHGLTIDLSSLFEQPRELHLAGRTLRTLSLELLTLHACFTVALGDASPRPVAVRDLAELALHPELDADEVLRLATAWRARAVVARAVSIVWASLGLADAVPLSAWAAYYLPTRQERRALAAYGSGRYASTARATLRVIPGIAEKAAFVRALALPDRAFVAHHRLGYAGWIRRGARAALSSPTRSG